MTRPARRSISGWTSCALEKPPRLVCRKRYAVQDSYEFDARERFEAALEAVLAGRILRDPQADALHVFFTKAGIVSLP